MKPLTLVLSCEHGGNDVPEAYQHLFAENKDILQTHQALDIGTLAVANHLSEVFNCPYIKSTVTRLLIDCNRHIAHPRYFSAFTNALSKEEKQILIDRYYVPYRKAVTEVIQHQIDKGNQVLHLSIHSFTPKHHGIVRNAAISLLYDSRRHGEKEVARVWQNLMRHHPPEYRIRVNYPYSGKADSFTATLRKSHPEQNYLGLEVEINQALVKDPQSTHSICTILSDSLTELLKIL